MKAKRTKRAPATAAIGDVDALRKSLRAKSSDVIDHLAVDAPPFDPDEPAPTEMSPAARALTAAMQLIEGNIMLDWTDANIAAVLECGGELCVGRIGPGRAALRAHITGEETWRDRVTVCGGPEIHHCETPSDRDYGMSHQPLVYAPPPPEPTAIIAAPAPETDEQRIAREQAEYEAAEAAVVAAAQRAQELRAKVAA